MIRKYRYKLLDLIVFKFIQDFLLLSENNPGEKFKVY